MPPCLVFLNKKQAMGASVEEQRAAFATAREGDQGGVGISAVSLGLRLLGIGPVLILLVLVIVVSATTRNASEPGRIFILCRCMPPAAPSHGEGAEGGAGS